MLRTASVSVCCTAGKHARTRPDARLPARTLMWTLSEFGPAGAAAPRPPPLLVHATARILITEAVSQTVRFARAV